MCAAIRATANPRAGIRPSRQYAPPAQSGSAKMACRPTSWNAMFCAEWNEAVAIGTAANTLAGNAAAHSSTCIPPIDPPMHANSRVIPRLSISRFCARTMSPIVTVGNSVPHGSSPGVFASRGPVVPMQPPSTLLQMTKNRSVSTGRPGPTTWFHQPGLPVTGCASATNWSPVRAWHNQDRVRPLRIQRPIRPVCDRDPRQRRSAFQHERLREMGGRRLGHTGSLVMVHDPPSCRTDRPAALRRDPSPPKVGTPPPLR